MSDALPEDQHAKPFSKLDEVPMADTKGFRAELTGFLERLTKASTPRLDNGLATAHPTTQRREAMLKIQEAIMWLGEDLRQITSKRK